MFELANIIKSDIEQVDARFSSWPPLPEEVDYHHVKMFKLSKLLVNLLLSKRGEKEWRDCPVRWGKILLVLL